jgi:V8-like Glu-specific endopeptidase
MGLLSLGSGCSGEDSALPAEALGEVEQRSICGGTADFQDVETYDGSYGVSIPYVNEHQAPVGQIKWKDDLASRYANPGNVSGKRRCSATLIAPDTILTAGHCFDTTDVGGVIFPKDATGVNITPQVAATELLVSFNYQKDPLGNLRPEDTYEIFDLLEYRLGGVDYALARLGGFPGQTYGVAPVSLAGGVNGDQLAIIGHPASEPKRVSAGNLKTYSASAITYANLDTLGGSSGAGILSVPRNAVIGVHTNSQLPLPGCAPQGGFNWGVPLFTIAQNSPVLSDFLNEKGAFWWAQSGTTPGTYNAASSFARAFVNSSVQPVTSTITRISQGLYDAVTPQVGSLPANIQVTAYGSGAEHCKIGKYSAGGGTVRVRVRCNAPSGALADSQFFVSYVKKPLPDGSARGAYLWLSDPTATSQPDAGRQWNSTGALNIVEHLATGSYRAVLPGLASVPRPGSVLVTAYGSGTEYCSLGGWGPDGASLAVNVKCFSANGAAADSSFMLNFNANVPLPGNSGAYAFGNDTLSASYTPSQQFAFWGGEGGPISTPITAGRLGVGRYFVQYPLNFLGSTTQVTAVAKSEEYCKIASWQPFPGGPGGSRVFINCFNPSGAPADTQFASAYATDQWVIN